ncbi:hypothetical protein [Microbacterium sp. 77mftsu3.1]|uniref:hypothetical protein n=1 Tax=Microbacterium sp. 77mftsu3.1 TaxID=1761802 RepID=UPI0003A8B43E|nr:hypothetical protein [Microbacterium sp. 77mftsu3.1]SDH35794.1 hypothetical protein SAMN04488590_3121 [Microbacterium sp. 77mftsu3.1]
MTGMTVVDPELEARRRPNGEFGSHAHTDPEVIIEGDIHPSTRGIRGKVTVDFTDKPHFLRRPVISQQEVDVVVNLDWRSAAQTVDDPDRGERIVDGQAHVPTGLSAIAPDDEVLALLTRRPIVTEGLRRADAAAVVTTELRRRARLVTIIDDEIWARSTLTS